MQEGRIPVLASGEGAQNREERELFVWKDASLGASQVTLEVKNPLANAGDMGLVLG